MAFIEPTLKVIQLGNQQSIPRNRALRPAETCQNHFPRTTLISVVPIFSSPRAIIDLNSAGVGGKVHHRCGCLNGYDKEEAVVKARHCRINNTRASARSGGLPSQTPVTQLAVPASGVILR
jgi:hypothetical protein